MSRRVTAVGITFVVVGTLLLAGPAFGFSSLTADRGVEITVAEGDDAYLGVDEEDGIDNLRDNERAADVFNNFEENLVISNIEVRNDDRILSGRMIPREIETGESEELELRCDLEQSLNEPREVEVVLDAETADGSASVSGVAFSLLVEINCGEGPPSGGSFTADDMSPGDESQTFQVTVDGWRGNSEATIDLREVDVIEYGDETVASTEGGLSAEFDVENERIEITTSGRPGEGTREVRLEGITVAGDEREWAIAYYDDNRGGSDEDAVFIESE